MELTLGKIFIARGIVMKILPGTFHSPFFL